MNNQFLCTIVEVDAIERIQNLFKQGNLQGIWTTIFPLMTNIIKFWFLDICKDQNIIKYLLYLLSQTWSVF